MDVRNAIDEWREAIPENVRSEGGAGAAMIAAGVVSGAFMLLRGRRGFFAWAIPGALIGAGLMMLADVGLDTRRERIAETEDLIAAELASLDPIARAQVLKGVSERQVRSILPGRD